MNGTDNAVHGSDCCVNAEKEITFHFPFLAKQPLLQGEDGK